MSSAALGGHLVRRAALVVLVGLAVGIGLLVGPVASARAEETPPPVGTTETFHAYDWGNDHSLDVAAVVRRVGEHCIVYVQKGHTVPESFLDGLATAFDDDIFPALTTVMGPAPDPGVDGQSRIVILLYAFNSPPTQGFFSGHDIDPAAPPDSNQREMIMLNLEAVTSSVELASAAAAHEFAHLIVYYRNFLLDPDPKKTYKGDVEYRWIEEGLAVYAELLSGHGSRADDFVRSFALEPTKNLTRWEGGNTDDYGASYSFMAFLVERTGQSLIRRLVDTPMSGITGIDAALAAEGSFLNFGALFDDWVVSDFLDGRPPASPYSIGSLDIAAVPVPVPTALPAVGVSDTENYSARYLDFVPTTGGAAVRVVIDGDDGPFLHAALISWDSAGVLQPSVEVIPVSPTTGGGWATSPPGYDRHTLAVWARGAESAPTTYAFRYSAAVEPHDEVQFLDVGSDHPYFPYIQTLLGLDVISGKELPPGSHLWYFRAEDPVLRAQFAKMIVEAAGIHTAEVGDLSSPTFSDVLPTFDGQGEPLAYPFDYVEEAAAAGIVNGFADGRFGPWQDVSRIQLVRMILRAGAAAGRAFPAYTGSQNVFLDVPPGSPLYADAMTAYTNGILTGSEPDAQGMRFFWPWRSATRGHVSKMTANLIGWLDQTGQP